MTSRKLNIQFQELLHLTKLALQLPLQLPQTLPLRLTLRPLCLQLPLRLALRPLPLRSKDLLKSQRLGMCISSLNLHHPPTNNSESAPQVSSHAQVIYVKA